jgi:outer membrane immunogenic protein
MHRFIRAGLMAAVAVFACNTADAANLPVKKKPGKVVKAQPPEPPRQVVIVNSWAGMYVGIHAGAACPLIATSNVAPFGGFNAGVGRSFDFDRCAPLLGGSIGYNIEAGTFIVGFEADVGFLDLRQSTVDAVNADFAGVRYGWHGTLTGRLGIAVDKALIYAKGGAAWARITNTASNVVGGGFDPLDFSEVTGTRWGWTVGGGIEFMVAPDISIKGEYLYMDFGTASGSNLDGDAFEHRNRLHTAKIGLNYRFNLGSTVTPISARF